jgi:hypothetical protein
MLYSVEKGLPPGGLCAPTAIGGGSADTSYGNQSQVVELGGIAGVIVDGRENRLDEF